jgi:Interferon-induced transmembrane protein
LCCCLPFGVVAIVYAAKVDGLVASGDIAGAEAASKSAKLWVNLSAGSVLIIIAIYIVIGAIGAVAGGM